MLIWSAMIAGQRVFILPLCRLIGPRAEWLMTQLARMALTYTALLRMLSSGTPVNEISPHGLKYAHCHQADTLQLTSSV